MRRALRFDWNDLRCFVALARSRGGTREASRALGVDPSTVQRRIAALEAQVGARLMERGREGCRLTDLGQRLLPVAEAMGSAARDMETALAAAQAVSPPIRLTCPEALVGRLAAAGLLERFAELHPGLRVEMLMSDAALDLAAGEADVAIRAGALRGDGLIARKLAASPWGEFASHGYVARHGRPGSPAELGAHAIVAFDGALAGHRAAKWLRQVAPDARAAARNGSIQGLVQSVSAGLGVAPLPVALGRDHDLAMLFGPVAALETSWHILTRRDLRRTRHVGAFFDFVLREIGTVRPILLGEAPSKAPQAAGIAVSASLAQ